MFLFYFWLRWVFVAARGFSLVVVRKGHFLLQCTGFSFCWLFLLQNTGFSMRGFSTCSLYDPEHGLNSCDIQAWSPRGMWKPLIKDWTCVPCIARWILIHWAMREVQCFCFCLNIHVLIWLFQFLVWHSDFFFFFSCGTWDLIPWPGIEPRPPAMGMRSLSHWTIREVLLW